jgi:hypothetical protein
MATVAVMLVLMIAAAGARAGTWVQVSCVNPDGSASTDAGWTGAPIGTPPAGSGAVPTCGPGVPMITGLSDSAAVDGETLEQLEYQPPAGSALAGGTIDANFSVPGTGTAQPVAGVFAPAFIYPTDVVADCVPAFAACSSANATTYSGTVTLPANTGGDVFVDAGCGGNPSTQCTSGADGVYAAATVSQADLLLSNSSVPNGTNFSGSATQSDAAGTAHLVFTVTDANGPGVYSVTVSVDGTAVYSGTPDTNGGACVSHGTATSGALMFDDAQPCPATEVVDVPVPLTGISNGAHELTATVTDAAGNTSTVLDQTITVANPVTTPQPTPVSGKTRHKPFASLVLYWTWTGPRTRLRSVSFTRLPVHTALTISCSARGCPGKHAAAGAGAVRRLLRKFIGRSFRAGTRLRLTFTEAGHAPELVTVLIRDDHKPRVRVSTD